MALPQFAELSRAIFVAVSTLFVPVTVKRGNVKVPVPGDPAVKTICAVVEATVFVPDILYVIRYVPEERLLLDMVAMPLLLVQALVAVRLRLLTLGFELVTETE